MKHLKLTILALPLLISCGGGDSIVSSATAQSSNETFYELYAILRPAPDGQWYIQNDVDHLSKGINLRVEQNSNSLKLHFSQTYTHAVHVDIGSDDDFRNIVSGYSNLGINSATIKVVANGTIIDPATVWNYVPQGGGNFWVKVVMAK